MSKGFNAGKIIEQVTALALPAAKDAGVELWEVEFVREGGIYYLRVVIDRDEGVTVEDCEKVCRAIMGPVEELPELAGRDDEYTMEISSAGIERQLKRPSDFEKFIGSRVLVRLYAADLGEKEFIGSLAAFEEGAVTLDTPDGRRSFDLKDTALIRLCPEL